MNMEPIAWPWIAVGVVWLIGAFTSKPTVRKAAGTNRWIEVGLLALAYYLVVPPAPLRHGWVVARFLPQSEPAFWLAFVFTASGCLFAIWARFYIGRNWSASITIKQDHQLMRGGPYSLVRHPIYAGFTLALAGTIMAVGQVHALFALPVAMAAFRHKARHEERLMHQQFGAEYERYRHEVKGLIPYVW